MKHFGISAVSLVFAALLLLSGCASSRKDISYNPGWGESNKLAKPVKGVVIPLEDMREYARTYPKQVIIQTDYSGNVSSDINDRAVDELVEDALKGELERIGVKVIPVKGVNGPLDKETADSIKKRITAEYPGAQVAFGARIKDFTATSKRTLIAHNVHVVGWMEFYVLDMGTGDLVWSDFKTEWEDTVASSDHNYMIGQLEQALKNLMEKSVRENTPMRDLLSKITNR